MMDSIQTLEQLYLNAKKQCVVAKETWIQAKKDQWQLNGQSKVIFTDSDGQCYELKPLLEYGDYFLISAATGRDWNESLKGKDGRHQKRFDSFDELKDAICETEGYQIIPSSEEPKE